MTEHECPIAEFAGPADAHARTLAELVAGTPSANVNRRPPPSASTPINTTRRQTKMTEPDITARRAELEAAVAEAEAEHREVQHQARAARDRVAQLREQLATRPSEEFGVDGSVKAKTVAAKLFAQLQAAERPPVAWERREQDAAGRVSAAQRALNLFISGNVAELVKARESEDTANNQRIIAAATEFMDAVTAKNRFEREIARLLVPARGLDPVNEIKSTDNLGQLRVELKRLVGTASRPRYPCRSARRLARCRQGSRPQRVGSPAHTPR